MKLRALFYSVFCAIWLSACQTSGVGTAATLKGDLTATFSWKSKSSVSGTMDAFLSNGQYYSGPFFQITHETRFDDVNPLWVGWAPGHRPHWDYWSAADWSHFATYYSGRVVANLAAQDGSHMRCRFHLANPSRGMSGGGQGDCQLPDEQIIEAVFPEQ